MSVDYDLVIIGGTMAARRAAVAASHFHARVALIEPSFSKDDYTYRKALNRSGEINQLIIGTNQLDIHRKNQSLADSPSPRIPLAEAIKWAEAVVYNQSEQISPAILASLGIDVISELGKFESKPHLAFVVKNRRLTARAYLIITGTTPDLLEIDGLQTTGYFTPANIWQKINIEKLPSSWVIIGDSPSGIELAQTLVRLGAEVTLIVKSTHILAKEDPEAAQLIQAQLEADGIEILTETKVTQVKQIENKKWVLAGNKAIEADEILLAVNQQPNIEYLNLAGVGVKYNRNSIYVNRKLQTTNSRIYACGDVLGGYPFANITDYEAKVAIKNALFLPKNQVNYHSIPWAIFSNPTLARVGLTEAQARKRYSDKVCVLRQYFKTVSKAQIIDETTGFCKIIVLNNGEILGATIVGAEAEELIYTIALCIRQKIKIDAIASLPAISPSLAQIIYQAATDWHRQRLSSNTALQNFLEWLFNWRRAWSS